MQIPKYAAYLGCCRYDRSIIFMDMDYKLQGLSAYAQLVRDLERILVPVEGHNNTIQPT